MTTATLHKHINAILTVDYPLCSCADIRLFLCALSIDYQPKIIIVGGTNGKGSTVAILERIFKYNNINFVSHTSPHLLRFNERIKYNGIAISNQSLISALIRIQKVVHHLNLRLSYYQIGFLCACVYMNCKMPAWFILEVGMGGRLDPANHFDADIAILTSIGLDHTEILGNNIETIGFEKTHIARPNKPIILGSAMPTSVNNYLHGVNANIIKASVPPTYEHSHLPKQSLACAFSAISCMTPSLTIPPNINTLQVPGRIEIIQKKPLIIVDVSHNPDAVSYLFAKSIDYKTTHKRFIGIFGTHATKDVKSMINIAKPHIDEWLIPNLHHIDNRYLGIDAMAVLLPKQSSQFFSHLAAVIKHLRTIITKDDLVIIFGSFTLVAEWMKIYEKQHPLC